MFTPSTGSCCCARNSTNTYQTRPGSEQLDASGGKAAEVGGQEVQGKQDNAGYHNELLTFAKNSFCIKGEQENTEGR